MKALDGGESLYGPEVLKTYVGKMSFCDKKIKACVELKGILGQK